jgi:hypothetical protein
VHQELRHAIHTAHSVVNISRISKSAAEPQTELSIPQAVLDNLVAQRFRVLGHTLLQSNDFAFWVMEWNTDKCLAELYHAAQAVWGLLIVVVVPYPSPSFLDSALNSV